MSTSPEPLTARPSFEGHERGLIAAGGRHGVDTARTLLFVPGNRPERFRKAADSGADLVVLDLEDAVPATEKEQARAHVSAWLAQGHTAVVRVNGMETPWYDDDIAATGEHAISLMIPKARPGPALRAAGRTRPVIALIETAAGVLDIRAVAATPGVSRLALGSLDLAAELGIDPADHLALAPARSALVLASAAEGLAAPVDGVSAAVDDEATLRQDATLARRLGYTGKLLIHPKQVEPVRDALGPSDDELRWARRVLANATGRESVLSVDGQMVDKPVIDRARRLLADAHGSPLAPSTESVTGDEIT